MKTALWALVACVPLLLGQAAAPIAEPGAAIVRNKCLICHGEELITSQRLTPGQWTKEVAKMTGWGAPLTPDEQQVLAAYLAKHYPVDRPRQKPPRVRLQH